MVRPTTTGHCKIKSGPPRPPPAHACQLGYEGIVSKRRGSRYESGRSSHWLKIKNPNHPAVLRLLEEDWNG
jgi:hypothetical protein